VLLSNLSNELEICSQQLVNFYLNGSILII